MKLIQILFFSLCLVPVSTSSGLSINYLFVLFPICSIIFNREVCKIPIFLVLVIGVFSVIYLIGLLSNSFLYNHLLFRGLFSFLIFMTVFSYTFIPIGDEMVSSFLWSIVLFAVFLTMKSGVDFIVMGTSDIGLAKKLIGSQRTGFIHLMAFFILFQKSLKLKKVHRAALIFIIIIGLLLTFSRAPLVALVLTYLLFLIAQFKTVSLLSFRWYFKVILGMVSLAAVILILFWSFPLIFDFFNERIIVNLVLNSDEVYSNPETSEGSRLEIWKSIWYYVIRHPFHGSGYLGVFVLEGRYSFGSAHSQYMDILFRTGLVGFLVYAFLLFKIIKTLRVKDQGLLWGVISLLVYGLFHETFKESQGAFILAFLIGFIAKNSVRTRQEDRYLNT